MSAETKYLIVVGGPTAAGKTRLAIALANHFGTEIISADSRQFYREMKIGTARPSAVELAAAKHYFVADRSVEEPLNAGQFAEEALLVLSRIYEHYDYAVVVGGSGLFIKALCEGLDTFPKVPVRIRNRVDELFKSDGITGLQNALKKYDPAYFQVVDQQNPARLQRALEVCLAGDQPYSYYLGKNAEKRTFIPIYLQPVWPRAELYARINQRVDWMVGEGLEPEARQLQARQNLAALQTVGYQEWFAHFTGETDRETAIGLIKQNSRRYAKRQLTWNRRDGHWKSVPRGDLRLALAYIQLVEKEGLSLVNTKAESKVKYISDKERKLSVGFTNTAGQQLGMVNLVALKEWGWMHSYSLGELSYLATIVLLHESLQRTEMPVVYIQSDLKLTPFIDQLGFKTVDLSVLPDKLIAQLGPGSEVWKWEREDPLF